MGILVLLIGFVLPFSSAFARDLSFSWTANSDDPPVDGYRLYYKIGNPGQTLNDYNGTNAAGGNPSPVTIIGQSSDSYILLNLLDDQTYSFVITAYRGSDESSAAPAVTAEPAVASTTRSATFAWTANTDVPPVDGYHLYYKTGDPGQTLNDYNGTDASGGNPSPVVIVGQSSTSYIMENLLVDQQYSFVLTAYRGAEESTPTTAIILNASGGSNAAPIASDVSINVNENSVYSGFLSASDPDGDSLQYSITTSASKGITAITNSATGAFTYTPNPNATGSDTFGYKVNDGTVDSNVATVTVSINNVNEQPQASNSSFATNESTPYSGQLTASDPDGDSLQYIIVANGSKGTVVINNQATGTFTYTPSANATGADQFSFKVNDGQLDSAVALVTVSISNVNDQPQASSTSFTTAEDTAHNGQLSASDADGDALQYSIVTGASKGTVVLTNTATGTFTYTPAADVTGGDSFTFLVNDGTINSAAATVTIDITPVNDTPVAHNVSFNAETNTEYSGQLSADDVDGDTLTYSIVSGSSKGSVSIVDAAAGTFVYTPNSNETGSDSFTFKVNDGNVDSAAGSVSVTIVDANTITAVFGDATATDYPGTLADTYTNLNTDINADQGTLNTYSWSGAVPQGVANTIIMKADLSVLPAYATVISAELHLFQTGASGEAEYSHTIHKIVGKDPVISQVNGYNAFNGEPWTPVVAGSTYNDIPLGLADIDSAEDTVILDNQNGYRIWTITEMVQSWIREPSMNYGLLIKGQETSVGTGRSFAAAENQSADIRPKLIIRYSTTPPAPQLIMIEEIK